LEYLFISRSETSKVGLYSLDFRTSKNASKRWLIFSDLTPLYIA
jgi:hypothetical protein